jgi:hypothetical protein
MAIELIEDSELGALAQSRLGNKCFLNDDDKYANLSWVSKKEKNRRADSDREAVDRVWRIDPIFEKNCTYLTTRLTNLQSAIKGELAKNPSKTRSDRTISPMVDWETQYKKKIENLKCVDTALEEEKSAEEKKNIEILKQTALDTTQFDVPEISGTSNISKYVLLGVGGLTLAIVLIAVLRK